jgi:hypothetical protein
LQARALSGLHLRSYIFIRITSITRAVEVINIPDAFSRNAAEAAAGFAAIATQLSARHPSEIAVAPLFCKGRAVTLSQVSSRERKSGVVKGVGKEFLNFCAGSIVALRLI